MAHWSEFNITDIFPYIKRGKRLTKKDRKTGNIPYYSATNTNNGCTDFISNPLFIEKDKIIITTFGDAYYVEGDFTASDEITILGNEKINKYSALFIVQCINHNKLKFNFGYKAFSDRIKRQKILLPIDNNGEPDYTFMCNFMKKIEIEHVKKITNYLTKIEISDFYKIDDLNSIKWEEFYLNEIFKDIQRGKRLTKAQFIDGVKPYISSSATTNGVDSFVGNKEKVRVFENCLTLANSGSVGSTFYHPYQFVASDHVTHLKNDNFNKYIYLFIASVIKRLESKYNFNREINDTRLKNEIILLPITETGDINYEFMEKYMKNIEAKLITKYLDYLKK